MKRKFNSPKIVKTSISMPDNLLDHAQQRCVEDGFNSLSAYFSHLVRLDKEQRELQSHQRLIECRDAGSPRAGSRT